ncbi:MULTISPECIES: CPBP family intramembrane glutamic endopeptidase [unclassified Roseivirga]|uniref:CPBP family intramembrane glutamic endopeptidase n=1 Tax=unclassified Roseivirga TaxID=2626142 RepID=UPI00257BE443|nr:MULTISPECIES: CPBP family intramembrane glutamic endopeptidase [unclassified Roseivirga]MEC7754601.1 CPBP family intramembrane glutamic endopeptidase [Bacteroidota bacterium]|tara:strand:+ start:3626 stop:4573 length:948 start_codon:yes stop_codon:yes gene_type:complete
MTRLDNGIDLTGGRTESSSFLILLGLLAAGFFVGQFVGGLVGAILALINGMGLDEFQKNPEIMFDYLSLIEVLSTQILYTLVFTFLVPWFYIKIFAEKKLSTLSNETKVRPIAVVVVVLATLTFMVVNSYFIEWNQNIKFPEFMSGFEKWARETEDQLAKATEKFTTFNNFGEFLFGFIAIALLPGIGEELLFRGLLQNSLQRLSKNKHLAIWLSALLFSAIHLQFYGLVPRMLLGALFGYFYVWSGNIWYPIIGHIANNGIQVILVYTAQVSGAEIILDDSETIPVVGQIVAVVFFIVLMFFFRNEYLRPKRLE